MLINVKRVRMLFIRALGIRKSLKARGNLVNPSCRSSVFLAIQSSYLQPLMVDEFFAYVIVLSSPFFRTQGVPSMLTPFASRL